MTVHPEVSHVGISVIGTLISPALLRAAVSSVPVREVQGESVCFLLLPWLILGSLEPLPQKGARCFSLGKYTLDSVAHGVKRPNDLMEVNLAVKAINREVRLPSAWGFPISYTAAVMLEAHGGCGSASEAGQKPVWTEPILVPWKRGNGLTWLMAEAQRSLPPGRKTHCTNAELWAWFMSFIRPRDKLRCHVRGGE